MAKRVAPKRRGTSATTRRARGGRKLATINRDRLAVVAPAPQQWPYAAALETHAIAPAARYELFIGGRWVTPKSRRYRPSVNPATEETLTRVAEAGAPDVDAAVRAARRAFEKYWRRCPGPVRAKYLFRIARAISERSRELAVLESLDTGKPIRESRDFDIPLAAAHFFYYAGWADKLRWASVSADPQPLGVAGQIIPWNFPLLMAAWKIAPALACGNTVVLKPAETTPLTALWLARIIEEADVPPGVVNIITGGGETGKTLVAHPGLDKVAFTGSTEVGKEIARECARRGRRVTLELGGKAANIVVDDAPRDQASEGIVNGVYFNQGHVCCAGSRLLVQEPILDLVVRSLERRIQTLRIGPPLDKNTDIGAINSKTQLQKIRALVKSGDDAGCTRHETRCALPDRGYWFPPTFFTGVAQSHRIAREEIFGPVLSVMSFRTPDEAVEKANNTPYGLSAGVWTDKGSKNFKIVSQLRAGVVWANTYNKFDPSSPFGGYKESGFGREGGRHGLAPYLR
jgi:aldehyde dehydrogenase (NAD+)